MRFPLVFLFFSVLLTSCTDPKVPTIVVVKNDDTFAPARVRPVLDKWQQATF